MVNGGKGWKTMGNDGKRWKIMKIMKKKKQWKVMKNNDRLWKTMKNNGNQWKTIKKTMKNYGKTMENNNKLWKALKNNKNQCKKMKNNEKRRTIVKNYGKPMEICLWLCLCLCVCLCNCHHLQFIRHHHIWHPWVTPFSKIWHMLGLLVICLCLSSLRVSLSLSSRGRQWIVRVMSGSFVLHLLLGFCWD